jgi:hypothetical protein
MADHVHGKPGHNQPWKIPARNPEREVGAFLSVLLAVANNPDPLPRPPGHITDDMLRWRGQSCICLLLKVSGTSCLAMSVRPCAMPCGSWGRSGRTSPIPIQAMHVAPLASGSYAPGGAAARGGRSAGASAVTSSSLRSGPTAAKIREGSGRRASERSGGSRSWKRNDHNGEAVRAAN